MAADFPPLQNDLLLRAARGMMNNMLLYPIFDLEAQGRRLNARPYGSCAKQGDTCQVLNHSSFLAQSTDMSLSAHPSRI